MKIGFNIKKIINKIANHETRITTLENSGGGGSSSINSYTLKLFDVMDNSIYEFNVNSIDNDVFLNIEFSQVLMTIDGSNIQNNSNRLGYFTLKDNENSPFKCKGTIPIVYQLSNKNGKNYKGFLKFTYDTANNRNNMELIVDNDDVNMWKNFTIDDISNTVTIYCSGIFQTIIE